MFSPYLRQSAAHLTALSLLASVFLGAPLRASAQQAVAPPAPPARTSDVASPAAGARDQNGNGLPLPAAARTTAHVLVTGSTAPVTHEVHPRAGRNGDRDRASKTSRHRATVLRRAQSPSRFLAGLRLYLRNWPARFHRLHQRSTQVLRRSAGSSRQRHLSRRKGALQAGRTRHGQTLPRG